MVWLSIIDGRVLLLPHSMHRILISYSGHRRPHLACSPSSTMSSTSITIDGMLSFMPNNRRDWWSAMDHSHGLLLCSINDGIDLCVCNPATRRWIGRSFPGTLRGGCSLIGHHTMRSRTSRLILKCHRTMRFS